MVNSGRAEVVMFGYGYNIQVDFWGNITTYRKNPYYKYYNISNCTIYICFLTTPIINY